MHEWIQDFSSFVIAVGVLAGLWQSWHNGRQLAVIHKATNSLTDRLVESTAISAEASGYEKGRKQEIIEGNERISRDGDAIKP